MGVQKRATTLREKKMLGERRHFPFSHVKLERMLCRQCWVPPPLLSSFFFFIIQTSLFSHTEVFHSVFQLLNTAVGCPLFLVPHPAFLHLAAWNVDGMTGALTTMLDHKVEGHTPVIAESDQQGDWHSAIAHDHPGLSTCRPLNAKERNSFV